MPNIVAFMGLAGSGKNTVAESLGFPEFAFAQPLKDCAKQLFNGDLEDREYKEIKQTLLASRVNDVVMKWTQKFYHDLAMDLPDFMQEPLSFIHHIFGNHVQGGDYIKLSPRDLLKTVGGANWLRKDNRVGEQNLITLITLNKINQMFSQMYHAYASITDLRLVSEFKGLLEQQYHHVQFMFVLRYRFNKSGQGKIVSSLPLSEEPHWTETLSNNLTIHLLDKANELLGSHNFNIELNQAFKDYIENLLSMPIDDKIEFTVYLNPENE